MIGEEVAGRMCPLNFSTGLLFSSSAFVFERNIWFLTAKEMGYPQDSTFLALVKPRRYYKIASGSKIRSHGGKVLLRTCFGTLYSYTLTHLYSHPRSDSLLLELDTNYLRYRTIP